MNFLPLAIILVLIGAAWPVALPASIAYFIIGGGLGAFFGWACRNHPDKTLRRWERPLILWNLYAWPLALICMFVLPRGRVR